jgi:chromosome segregation ATPase
LTALLVEVRGLRSAMEEMASVGPRIQLPMAQLQLQEQRVNGLVRRADAIHDALNAAQKRAGELQDLVVMTQRDLEGSLEPDRRSQLESVLAVRKRDLARGMAEVSTLQTNEADIAAQIASEQARWVEINQRLADLDRALTLR